MSKQLKVSVGQYSDKGRKDINQDFHGAYIPNEPQLSSKGIAVALADGISSSAVSHVASTSAVSSFMEDYFCTPEAWSVKKSAQRVLFAANSWLHSQTRQSQFRYEKDKGYVCTFSAIIFKSTTAHIFHVGDSRIYRVRGDALEQLTNDHRVWLCQDKSYLSRALGINPQLEIDYHASQMEKDDIFVLVTDGVYEHTDSRFILNTIQDQSQALDTAAKLVVDEALQKGSTDNLTMQIIRIDELPEQDVDEVYQKLTELPFPPTLESRMLFDGYTIARELHASSRSHVFLAKDSETQTQVIIKTPSTEGRSDPAYLERFLMEDWIARRIQNTHVLKPFVHTRKRNFLYIVTEFIDGQTLAQWIIDNPKPDLETVRHIVDQIIKGLRAFHRLDMLHQDLKPDNVMIDQSGTVKIIDFGSTQVAGIMEISSPIEHFHVLGTEQYSAPEYFLGENGSSRSDIFSLGVITYQMLAGRLPYGTQVSKCKTRAAQNKLRYRPIRESNREFPTWIDDAIRKAVHPNPLKRYWEMSAFMFDLRHPNKEFLNKSRPPLIERNPVLFWKSITFVLAAVVVVLFWMLHTKT